MNESKEMKTQDKQGLHTQTEPELSLNPAVDIYEDAHGITLKADLPGVSRDRLNIEVDGNTLALKGQVSIDMPKDMQALHADVRATRYERNFTLSNELEADKISAEMKDGVLTLSVPKRAELQPRKIEVSVS